MRERKKKLVEKENERVTWMRRKTTRQE